MSGDYFIIMEFCLVCEHYQAVIGQQSLRRCGYTATLSDEEVFTIETCGE
jgi:hypothetical protein